MRLKPVSAILVVLAFAAVIVVASYAYEGRFGHSGYTRVSPDRNGRVELDIGELERGQVEFYRFLNYGNQEVKFFVGRDIAGHVQVAFDANEICAKLKRGYTHQDEWMVCNKCDRSFKLAEVNEGHGGCWPVPLAHQLNGDRLVIAENDILAGWRYFR